MRELQLLCEYLRKRIGEKQRAALKQIREGEMEGAKLDSLCAHLLEQVLEDAHELEKDAGKFIEKFLTD